MSTIPDLSSRLAISDAAAPYVSESGLRELFELADGAMANAYAPYSGFRVGAAILGTAGHITTAGNVENASYGLTICAERSAVVGAIAEGETSFAAIAVAADHHGAGTVAPCGACLQVLAEFDPQERLLVAFPDKGSLRVMLLRELMPVRFSLGTEES
jgi:cytidine deaminase